MGIFDIFSSGTPAERALKLKPKVTQKFGDPASRQKAISQLGDMKSADAVPVLMQRFTFNVEPQTTDHDEKETVFNMICDLDTAAVPHVVDFLKRSDAASSWALKILDEVVKEDEVIGIVTDELNRLGAEYTRDPEKKEVLLHHLSGKTDARVGPSVTPFLHDMSDDVKIAAIKTIGSVKHEPAREPLLQLLTTEDTAKRVQQICIQALVDTGFQVQGFREKVEARLVDPYFVDRSGAVKKRGET
jgi:HEAT repeat protein